LQLGADGKQYPSRFGSITWNEWESRYSQAKIEIYGLWHALQAYQLYIIGIKNLWVKIDASYIKSMLTIPTFSPALQLTDGYLGSNCFISSSCTFWVPYTPGRTDYLATPPCLTILLWTTIQMIGLIG